ncbi:hypothetical protein ACJX0J_027330, partial [Zea mays]
MNVFTLHLLYVDIAADVYMQEKPVADLTLGLYHSLAFLQDSCVPRPNHFFHLFVVLAISMLDALKWTQQAPVGLCFPIVFLRMLYYLRIYIYYNF